MNGKVFIILNPTLFVGIFSDYGGTEKFLSLADSNVQTFLEGKENQYTKRKTENFVFGGFGNSITSG